MGLQPQRLAGLDTDREAEGKRRFPPCSACSSSIFLDSHCTIPLVRPSCCLSTLPSNSHPLCNPLSYYIMSLFASGKDNLNPPLELERHRITARSALPSEPAVHIHISILPRPSRTPSQTPVVLDLDCTHHRTRTGTQPSRPNSYGASCSRRSRHRHLFGRRGQPCSCPGRCSSRPHS